MKPWAMVEGPALQLSFEDLTLVLQNCRSVRNTSHALHLHASVCQSGLEAYPSLGNQLILTLGEVGQMCHAEQVFQKLAYHYECSWSFLIISYVKNKEFGHARMVYDQAQELGTVHLSSHAFVALLKACTMLQDYDWGCKLHTEVVDKELLAKDCFIASALVHMFSKFGYPAKAEEIFDNFPIQDVVVWNALIAGYADQGQEDKALYVFHQMHHEGVPFNGITLVCCLSACSSVTDHVKGQELHAEALKTGLESELDVGNCLVDLYMRCGWLTTGQKVFDKLVVRDVVSWNVLIAGYVEKGKSDSVLSFLNSMQKDGIASDDVTFLSALKCCTSLGDIDKGWEMHAMIVKLGYEMQPLIGNTLVDMYAKCGCLETAEKVCDMLPSRDAILWNALVAGYADCGCIKEALDCLEQMREDDIEPSSVTFVSILKGCGGFEATYEGQVAHLEVTKLGVEKELLVGSTLVDMYAKCALLMEAQKAFNELPHRTAITWNTLIAGYANAGHGKEALHCFEKMQMEGMPPCAVTLICILKACREVGSVVKHQEIHTEVTKRGLERELLVGNVLVDSYAKWGLLAEAQYVFDGLSAHDVVSWSSLIVGLTEWGCVEGALECLEEMQRESIPLNPIIIVCTLKACGNVGAVVKGQELHSHTVKIGLESEHLISNTLVDMYSNCGSLLEAQAVFQKLLAPDGVSWNALISGYAQLGESENVLHVFDEMLGKGLTPTHVTFLNVMNACSHAGLVDKGQLCLEAIMKDYGITPSIKHYSCAVDVLGRSGFLNKGLALLEKIPLQPDTALWFMVLGACRKWADVGIGQYAFAHAVELDGEDSTAYVCMSNIYADAAMQRKAEKLHPGYLEQEQWKNAGSRWSMGFEYCMDEDRELSLSLENSLVSAQLLKVM